MTHPALTLLTEHLHAEGRVRVWSVIVTILGEIAMPQGGEMPMADIVALCQRIGIEEQAVRTAMSRLAKDDLVKSRRSGRVSFYTFSDNGLQKYETAAQAIYAAPKTIDEWCIGVPQPGAKFDPSIIKLHPLFLANVLLVLPADRVGNIDNAGRKSCFWTQVTQPDLPAWAVKDIIPNPSFSTCDTLISACDFIQSKVPDQDDIFPLRLTINHFWRRMVLRYPWIETPLDDAQWPLAKVHREIAKTYPILNPTSDRFTGI